MFGLFDIKFEIFGCTIKLNFYFFAMLAFMLVMDPSGLMIFGVLSALMHEFGHITAMILQKNYIKEIWFGFFSLGIVDSKRILRSYRENIFVLISGSFINFVMAFILKLVYLYTGMNIINVIFYQNIYIGILNLLPISILDGGQIAFIILEKKIGLNKALKVTQVISITILMPILVMGFLILLQSKYNFSLLILGCYLMAYLIFKDDYLFV